MLDQETRDKRDRAGVLGDGFELDWSDYKTLFASLDEQRFADMNTACLSVKAMPLSPVQFAKLWEEYCVELAEKPDPALLAAIAATKRARSAKRRR